MTTLASSPEAKPSTSTFVRWCKFNLVGGMGIVVQFAALLLLKSVLHFNYLLATAIAVEAAVIHNFVWHEQFTWVDRVSPHSFGKETTRIRRRPQASRKNSKIVAPLGAVTGPTSSPDCSAAAATSERYRQSFRRLLRFNLTNGAVSILGNLALMKVMVGEGHMNYLLANAIAITLCSLANFLVSDAWVFDCR
jgi:putative flippase GtrA